MKFAYYLVFALWYLLSLLPLRVLYFFLIFCIFLYIMEFVIGETLSVRI